MCILVMSYPPQFLEKVTFLHLGFNKLRVVPRFASKAKYTLTVLNLRNNQLDTIEGGRGIRVWLGIAIIFVWYKFIFVRLKMVHVGPS